MAVVAIVIIVAIVVMQQPTQPKGNIVEMKTPVTDVGKIDPTQIP